MSLTIQKCGSLEQRMVYCISMQEEQVAHVPKHPQILKEFQQNLLRARSLKEKGGTGLRVCD